MEVNDFEILLIDVAFYHYHVQKLVFIVLIKIEKNPKIIGLAHKERFLYTISPWASAVSGYIILPVTLERVSSFQKENLIWFDFPLSHISTPIVYVNLTMQSWPVLLCCVVYIWNWEYH